MALTAISHSIRRFRIGMLACVVAGLVGAQHAEAQQVDLSALRDRFDANSFRSIVALVDSARAANLPTDPLISKAQEGLLKRATPVAIVAATRGLFLRLRQSREILGAGSAPDELEAGASALRAGARPDQLAELRSSRAGKAVTVPLVVFADLLSRGVPRDTAARALQLMVEANATDAAFNTLRLNIERDITGGMSPAASAGMRYRALMKGAP